MERNAERCAKHPTAIRQFYHSTALDESCGSSTPSRPKQHPTNAPKTPPRFRFSLRSAVKDIISKDWEGLALHTAPEPPQMVPEHRPDPVRMKDSDDYITERAANPRTGLISPSLGTSTPCRESTPNTPGDALKMFYHDSPTPNPAILRRANEGRKIGSNEKWTAGEHAWQYGGALEERAGTPHTLPEDYLVHMPSAHEPQPFTYPGYSSEQIEAFEHYRRKARRVSSEGYDRRLLQSSRIPSYEDHPLESDVFLSCAHQGQDFRPYNGLHKAPQVPPQLVVRKRNATKSARQANDPSPTSEHPSGRGVQTSTSNFSPATISGMHRCVEDRQGTSRSIPGAYCISKPAQNHPTASEKIPKRSCMAPRRGSVHNVAKGNHDDEEYAIYNGHPKAESTVSDMTDLSILPRVTLVRPEHAAIPVSRGLRQVVESGRKCSLGCHRDVSGHCLEQRKVSHSAAADRLFSAELLQSDNGTDTVPVSAEKAEEILMGIMGIAAWLLCYIKDIQIPRSGLIEELRSPNATAKEKAAALKAALSLAGHVLAVGTALAMIWQLSAAVIQLLQIALWPLAVPFRILKWLLGAA